MVASEAKRRHGWSKAGSSDLCAEPGRSKDHAAFLLRLPRALKGWQRGQRFAFGKTLVPGRLRSASWARLAPLQAAEAAIQHKAPHMSLLYSDGLTPRASRNFSDNRYYAIVLRLDAVRKPLTSIGAKTASYRIAVLSEVDCAIFSRHFASIHTYSCLIYKRINLKNSES